MFDKRYKDPYPNEVDKAFPPSPALDSRNIVTSASEAFAVLQQGFALLVIYKQRSFAFGDVAGFGFRQLSKAVVWIGNNGAAVAVIAQIHHNARGILSQRRRNMLACKNELLRTVRVLVLAVAENIDQNTKAVAQSVAVCRSLHGDYRKIPCVVKDRLTDKRGRGVPCDFSA